MFVVLLPVLKKFAPFLIVAGLFFVSGSYIGYRLEYGVAEGAKLALATQQKNDAAAAAAANALAATYLAEIQNRNNDVEQDLAAVESKAGSAAASLAAQIVNQAARPGQDAVDAPVLETAFDDIAKESP